MARIESGRSDDVHPLKRSRVAYEDYLDIRSETPREAYSHLRESIAWLAVAYGRQRRTQVRSLLPRFLVPRRFRSLDLPDPETVLEDIVSNHSSLHDRHRRAFEAADEATTSKQSAPEWAPSRPPRRHTPGALGPSRRRTGRKQCVDRHNARSIVSLTLSGRGCDPGTPWRRRLDRLKYLYTESPTATHE